MFESAPLSPSLEGGKANDSAGNGQFNLGQLDEQEHDADQVEPEEIYLAEGKLYNDIVCSLG